LLIASSTPFDFDYEDGNSSGQIGPFTRLIFKDLTRFALEAHKESFKCGPDGAFTCVTGYVGMDSDFTTGYLHELGASSATFLNLPAGWNADELVWAFKTTSPTTGAVATIGGLTCPPQTQIWLGGEVLNERFCNGDLLDGTILDKL
jgi:hypothetical protein